jgi:single-strand DNA-binding protein
MAKHVNKVILLGNVGKDPEVKFLPSGAAVANFSIATSDRYKDKAGEWQERTEWHNVAAFARTAEIVRDYVKKGSKLYVEGRLTTRSWDDKDTGEGEGGGGGSTSYSKSGSSSGAQGGYAQPAPDYGDTGITDDDIPF